MDTQLDAQEWFGRRVNVVIDRPLGSRHPQHSDIVYEVNYGFVPGTTAPDGEPVDVYVLGEKEPVESFNGVVVAIIRRADDVEDRLVVARSQDWTAL